jgi:hypothetical protein
MFLSVLSYYSSAETAQAHGDEGECLNENEEENSRKKVWYIVKIGSVQQPLTSIIRLLVPMWKK